MPLSPQEFDTLMIRTLAGVALRRKEHGLRLNHPEAVALISVTALNGAKAGKSVEDVMAEARRALSRNDVMEGVADMIPSVQVHAVFSDGSRLLTIRRPIA